MDTDTIAQASAKWFWDQFGKSITDKALGAVEIQWAKFHWNEAEIRYRERIYQHHSTVRILGYPNPISVEKNLLAT